MKIRIDNILGSLSFLGFILCFFTFLLYHLGIYSNFWDNFLPNYFSLTLLTMLVIYLAFLFPVLREIKNSDAYIIGLVLSIFLYAALVTGLNYNNKYPFLQSVEFLVMFFCFFCMGFFLKNIKLNWTKIFLPFLLIIFLLIINSSLLQGKFSIAILSEDDASGYQTISRNFLAFFLLGYSVYVKTKWGILYLLLMIVSLFLIGARSEFIIFTIISTIMFVIEMIKYRRAKYVILLLVIGCLGYIFSYQISSIDSRQLQLLNVDDSSSWNARKTLTDKAIHTISQNWFYGDFGSHLEEETNVGLYSHNILSGYVNYGLFFFSIYIIIFILIIWKNFYLYLKSNHWFIYYSLLLNLICFLLLILAKPIFWPITYLGWGVFTGAYYIVKFNKEDI